MEGQVEGEAVSADGSSIEQGLAQARYLRMRLLARDEGHLRGLLVHSWGSCVHPRMLRSPDFLSLIKRNIIAKQFFQKKKGV